MSWRRVGFALVIVLATGFRLAALAASHVPDDRLIVPGKRMGNVPLTMTIDDLLRANGMAVRGLVTAGAPPSADAVYNSTALYWNHLGISAITLDGRRVEALGVVWYGAIYPGYRTHQGIGYGSNRAAVLSVYGGPTAETAPGPGWTRLIYDAAGIAFTLDGNKKLVEIFVFRPRGADRLWHLL